MLSLQLRRYFAVIGARLLVRARPKRSTTQLAVRHDAKGPYVEVVVPRLSRRNLEVLAIHPRQKRLLLKLTHRSQSAYVLIDGRQALSVRALTTSELREVSRNMPALYRDAA